MDNENMRENENINEELTESQNDEIKAEDAEVTESEAVEEISDETEMPTASDDASDEEDELEEVAEFEEEYASTEDMVDEENESDLDCEEDECDETVYETDQYDDEVMALIEQNEAAKKSQKLLLIVVAAVAAVVVAIVAYCACVVNGVGSKTVVGNPIPAEEGMVTSTIKYENPVMSLFETLVPGKNGTSAISINDETVDLGVFKFVANSAAVNYAYSLYQDGKIPDLSKFDWNSPEEKTGISHKEYSKGEAVQTLVPIYSLIGEGKKRGITLSADEEKEISDWIAQLKQQYGDEFELVLRQSGYETEDTLIEIQKIQRHMQKVYDDLQADLSKYASNEQLKNYMNDSKITVKHILVMGEDDEKKAEAKAKAEEILAKINSGEDFDKLIEEYNEDPGQTADGYTFAQDGSMVKEFEDAAFQLEVGQVSGLVETSFGYHIIKRVERTASVDEYMNMLVATAKVRLKKGAYDNVDISIDLNDYFGGSEGAE